MASTSETALETTLNDLANARLRDKAPGLVNYMVGFQLLKCNDEGSRAVGIFGFEIDDSIYYCPVFFLNGEVKGLDSLYAVDSDLFMPLTEDWINSLIHRKAQKIGDPDKTSPQQRGVRFPDYRRLTQLPPSGAKTAGQQVLDSMLDVLELTDVAPSLPETLVKFGCADDFLAAMRRSPKLAAAVGQFYDALELLPEARPKVAAEANKLVIIGAFTDEGTDALTDDQRRTVLRGGIAVSDKRPETSHSMVWRTGEELGLSSPSTNGLYDVVMADGSIEAALCYRLSQSDKGDSMENLLVVTKDKAGFVPYRKVRTAREYSRPEREKFLDQQGSKPDSLSVGDTVSFLSRTGEISIPVTILSILNGIDGLRVYGVQTVHYLHEAMTKVSSHQGEPSPPQAVPVGAESLDRAGTMSRPRPMDRIEQVIVRPGAGTRLSYAVDKMIISEEGFRAIKLGRNGELSKPLNARDLGDMTTITSLMPKIAQDVSIWRSADGLVNVRDAGPARSFSKVAAVRHLAGRLGIEGEEALGLVEGASSSPQRLWVKTSADLMSFPEVNDRSDTGTMSQFHPQEVPWETKQTTPSEDNSRFYDYQSPFGGGQDGQQPDESNTLEAVSDAAETGSKEVFDASALMSIIKSSRPTELVERYLPAIIAGMDRLGRLLFTAFWHYDEYKERFGDDLPDLIDSLRSTFEHLGDIVTEIKKRSLSGDADYFGVGLLD